MENQSEILQETINKDFSPIGLDQPYWIIVENNPINFIDPYGLINSWKGWAGVITGGVGLALKSPPLIIIGGGIVVWDWYDSIQDANKKGRELADQYEKLRKPEKDRIKDLINPENGC